MQGASKRRFTLLLLSTAVLSTAVFVGAPATALAKPKPARYVLVSRSKGCRVTLNAKTGDVTFAPEKGHYGKFTVVIKHGKKRIVYDFTVKKPKAPAKPPTKPTPTRPTPTPAPSLLTLPALNGNAVQGQTLTLAPGTWANSTTQDGVWDDCDSAGNNCSVSSKPSGDTDLLAASDVGHTIVVAETAVGPGGSTTVDSEPTGVVTSNSTTPPGLPPSPYPVIEASVIPPPGEVIAPGSDPGQSCRKAAVTFNVAGDFCDFTRNLETQPAPDAIATPTEMAEVCDDWDAVLNYLSRGGAPEWWLQGPGLGSTGTLNENDCFAVTPPYAVGPQIGSYVFAFNLSNASTGILNQFVASINATIFPYALPFT